MTNRHDGTRAWLSPDSIGIAAAIAVAVAIGATSGRPPWLWAGRRDHLVCGRGHQGHGVPILPSGLAYFRGPTYSYLAWLSDSWAAVAIRGLPMAGRVLPGGRHHCGGAAVAIAVRSRRGGGMVDRACAGRGGERRLCPLLHALRGRVHPDVDCRDTSARRSSSAGVVRRADAWRRAACMSSACCSRSCPPPVGSAPNRAMSAARLPGCW